MAFESLSDRLTKAIRNISGQGKLTEKNMNDMLKEVRMSLLELWGCQRLCQQRKRKGFGSRSL